jgi:hypothetical protein
VPPQLPRIRQVVLAARDLDPVANRLRDALHLGEPFSDPGVREVFAVTHEDIAEVHLHPADMRGAIVSLSEPRPPEAWRWGGPDWDRRRVPGNVEAIRVAV